MEQTIKLEYLKLSIFLTHAAPRNAFTVPEDTAYELRMHDVPSTSVMTLLIHRAALTSVKIVRDVWKTWHMKAAFIRGRLA